MVIDNKIIIAIDGHSSSGKSTLAKDLAKVLTYKYIDSGAMYRAVTLYCLRNGLVKNGEILEDKLRESLKDIHIEFRLNRETNHSYTYLNGENIENEIREIEVSNLVSPVSRIAFVREAMVRQQRELGKDKGIVMDGRDIGTVVYPDAELKIFMTASHGVRSKRRYDELVSKGSAVSEEDISKNVLQRDFIDSNREHSPLKQAGDAVLLDNSCMNREEQLEWALNLIRKRFSIRN